MKSYRRSNGSTPAAPSSQRKRHTPASATASRKSAWRCPGSVSTRTTSSRGSKGRSGLRISFDGRSQLAVYHFMFGPDWQEGCPGCSLLCDHVDGARQHFEHNDLSFVAVSRGTIERLEAYRKRMGWNFRWVSSAGSDFNVDFHVSFPKGTREGGVFYNFGEQPDPEIDELPGISMFYMDEDGAIYHTYSNYARGGEDVLGVYAWLDMAPKGRNETQSSSMRDWMKRHDRYENDGRTRPLVAAP